MSGGVDDYSGVTDIARNGVDKVIRLERENAALRARVAESDAEIARLRERVAQLEPKAARYEWLRDVLGIGNLLYQSFRHTPDYAQAFERSWFQFAALMFAVLYVWVKRAGE